MIGMTLTDNIYQSHRMVWGHRTAPHTFRESLGRSLVGSSPRTEGFALISLERMLKTKIKTVYYHTRYLKERIHKTTFDS